jgi:ferrous-iron efflux pump FieF
MAKLTADSAIDEQRSARANSTLAVAAAASLILAVLKLVAFVVSGSTIILGSLLDSVSDSVISLVNHRLSILARAAPDREHPFGHGGIEVASSLFQGLVLAGFGVYLTIVSIGRIFDPVPLLADRESFVLAFGILIFASASGYALQWLLKRSQRQMQRRGERSLSIAADAGHYEGDFWFNLFNAVGLLAIWFTGEARFDGAFAVIGAGMFIRSSYPVLRQGIRDLLHTEVSPEEQKSLAKLVLAVDTRIEGLHRLRTRRSGPTLFVDFHLKLPAKMPLDAAHAIGEKVAQHIRRNYPRADVVIHLDPDNEPDDDYWDPAYQTQPSSSQP